MYKFLECADPSSSVKKITYCMAGVVVLVFVSFLLNTQVLDFQIGILTFFFFFFIVKRFIFLSGNFNCKERKGAVKSIVSFLNIK